MSADSRFPRVSAASQGPLLSILETALRGSAAAVPAISASTRRIRARTTLRLRQLRDVPATTDCLHQQHARVHATAQDVDLVSWMCGLRRPRVFRILAERTIRLYPRI